MPRPGDPNGVPYSDRLPYRVIRYGSILAEYSYVGCGTRTHRVVGRGAVVYDLRNHPAQDVVGIGPVSADRDLLRPHRELRHTARGQTGPIAGGALLRRD